MWIYMPNFLFSSAISIVIAKLEKQKEGKKKMRQLGSVQVSPEAFMAVLKLGDDD